MTATKTPAKRTRKTTRRSFGAVRKLPSGKFQARYFDDTGIERTAPQTFTTKTAADEWLTTERADILRGTYRSPDLGAITFAEYFTEWMANKTDLSPSTRQMYENHGSRWLLRDLVLPGISHRKERTLNIGTRNLNTFTVGIVREWLAAANYTQKVEAAARTSTGKGWKERRHDPCRVWASSKGHPVKDMGRISPAIRNAWEKAGKPVVTPKPLAIDAHSKPAVVVAQSYRTLRACMNEALRDPTAIARLSPLT